MVCESAADGPEAIQKPEFCGVLLPDAADRRFSERDDRAAAAVSAEYTRLYRDLGGTRALRRLARAAPRGADYRTTSYACPGAQHHRLRLCLLYNFLLHYGKPAQYRSELRRVIVAAH